MPGIEVTGVEVRIPPVLRADRSLRAYARVTLNGAVIIDNFRVEQATSGRLSLGFPLRPKRVTCGKCGKSAFVTQVRCGHCLTLIPRWGWSRDYVTAVAVVSPDLRRMVELAVLRAYDAATTPALALKVS